MFRLFVWLGALACALGASAQPLPLDPPLTASGSPYLTGVPAPETVLGTRVGVRHARPDEIVTYFRSVDAASDRVAVHEYARTYEGRPLLYAVVTSPANHARLDAILAANRRLSEDPGAVSDAALADMPGVVWMGYSVHGNEASGGDAALLTLYHLVAGTGDVEATLDDLVLLLLPDLNPDGRARFVGWSSRYAGAVPVGDPQDVEHREAWPGGRTNHYWFDLNRDWMPVVHPESEARLRLFHEVRPQLLLDFHEMGGESTFFFQPGVPSRTNPNTPALNQELTGRIAAFHARRLDGIGSLYFTKEGYDDFYYGKGSTYPDVNGAVGILFEQASSRARVADTRNNGRMPYGFTVRNQLSAALSSIEAAQALRLDLLRMQRDFYREAGDFARRQPMAGFVFGDGGDPQRAAMLVELLRKHRIRVHRLGRALERDGERFAPDAAYVVPLDQPQARLIHGLFERPKTFTDSLFYDVSAWTLPLAYGLPMAELARGDGAAVGAEVTEAPAVTGTLVGGTASYAYLVPWNRFLAPRALARLQAAGLRVRLAAKPFRVTVAGQTRDFPRGVLVVPVGAQDVPADTVHAAVARAVAEDGVEAFAVSTGLNLAGPDLGSGSLARLDAPRLALVVGEGTDAGNAGEVWHVLGERFGLAVSLLDARDFGRLDLSDYTVLLMAGGSYRGVDADAVKTWVRNGGRLVATSSAADWAADNGLVALQAREARSLDSLLRRLPYAELSLTRGAQAVGGSIFMAQLDTTHPLAFGLPERLPFFRDASNFFDPSTTPGTNVAVYTDAPLVAGYLSDERLAQASGAAAVVAANFGRGQVIVMPDNPTFRGFWLGTTALYMNAIFLGGAF